MARRHRVELDKVLVGNTVLFLICHLDIVTEALDFLLFFLDRSSWISGNKDAVALRVVSWLYQARGCPRSLDSLKIAVVEKGGITLLNCLIRCFLSKICSDSWFIVSIHMAIIETNILDLGLVLIIVGASFHCYLIPEPLSLGSLRGTWICLEIDWLNFD